jgi:RNA polymerase sigma-70 factor (ECF subfamily)
MVTKRTDDSLLVTLYQEGNEKAFEELLLRHKDRIYRAIYLKIRNQELAEDIFQETFVKIVKTLKLGNYNEEGKFLPWALRIANNLVIDHFRKANKVRMISESSSLRDDFNIFSTLSSEDKNVQEHWCQRELEEQMVHLIEFLPAAQSDILKMRLYEDLSFKEIADKENISINTALGRMRYALINLRKMVEHNQLVTDY